MSIIDQVEELERSATPKEAPWHGMSDRDIAAYSYERRYFNGHLAPERVQPKPRHAWIEGWQARDKVAQSGCEALARNSLPEVIELVKHCETVDEVWELLTGECAADCECVIHALRAALQVKNGEQ